MSSGRQPLAQRDGIRDLVASLCLCISPNVLLRVQFCLLHDAEDHLIVKVVLDKTWFVLCDPFVALL